MNKSDNSPDFQTWLKDLKVRAQKGIVPETHEDREFIKEVRSDERMAASLAPKQRADVSKAIKWKELSTGHKMNAGISGACSIMAALSSVNAAKNSIGRDEEGKAHIQWSNVGVALLEATVAAGCAYFAVEALHGRSPF